MHLSDMHLSGVHCTFLPCDYLAGVSSGYWYENKGVSVMLDANYALAVDSTGQCHNGELSSVMRKCAHRWQQQSFMLCIMRVV